MSDISIHQVPEPDIPLLDFAMRHLSKVLGDTHVADAEMLARGLRGPTRCLPDDDCNERNHHRWRSDVFAGFLDSYGIGGALCL